MVPNADNKPLPRTPKKLSPAVAAAPKALTSALPKFCSICSLRVPKSSLAFITASEFLTDNPAKALPDCLSADSKSAKASVESSITCGSSDNPNKFCVSPNTLSKVIPESSTARPVSGANSAISSVFLISANVFLYFLAASSFFLIWFILSSSVALAAFKMDNCSSAASICAFDPTVTNSPD